MRKLLKERKKVYKTYFYKGKNKYTDLWVTYLYDFLLVEKQIKVIREKFAVFRMEYINNLKKNQKYYKITYGRKIGVYRCIYYSNYNEVKMLTPYTRKLFFIE